MEVFVDPFVDVYVPLAKRSAHVPVWEAMSHIDTPKTRGATTFWRTANFFGGDKTFWGTANCFGFFWGGGSRPKKTRLRPGKKKSGPPRAKSAPTAPLPWPPGHHPTRTPAKTWHRSAERNFWRVRLTENPRKVSTQKLQNIRRKVQNAKVQRVTCGSKGKYVAAKKLRAPGALIAGWADSVDGTNALCGILASDLAAPLSHLQETRQKDGKPMAKPGPSGWFSGGLDGASLHTRHTVH